MCLTLTYSCAEKVAAASKVKQENVLIKLGSGVLKHSQISKKDSAQGADKVGFYSYEGGPNESQKAPERESNSVLPEQSCLGQLHT